MSAAASMASHGPPPAMEPISSSAVIHLQSLQQPLRPERQQIQILAAERLRQREEEFLRNLPTPDPQCPCIWSPRVRLVSLIAMALIAYFLLETIMLGGAAAMLRPKDSMSSSRSFILLSGRLEIIVPHLFGYVVMHELWRYLVYGDAIQRWCSATWLFLSIIVTHAVIFVVRLGQMQNEDTFFITILLLPFLHLGFRPSTWRWVKRELLPDLQFESIAPEADVATTAAVCLPWSGRHWLVLALEFAAVNMLVQVIFRGYYDNLFSLPRYN